MADELFAKRLRELMLKTIRRDESAFTHFMDISQISTALNAAHSEGICLALNGGYPDAERQMGAFYFSEEPEERMWPIRTVEISWRAQFGSPEHRDLLGALMALGFERERMGDIVLAEGKAYVFSETEMAEYIAATLNSAGRTTVKCRLTDTIPNLPKPAGKIFRDTVPSMRLDAILAAGFAVSRSEAAEWIAQGRAFSNQALQTKGNCNVREGDILSVRGKGRVRVEEIEGETKKGRIAVRLFRYGG